MILLLQLNGDIPERFPGHERWLYIFGCGRKTCRRKDGCVRGLRGIRRSKLKSAGKTTPSPSVKNDKPQSAVPVDIGAAIFGNPTSGSSSGIPTNSFSTKANPFSSSSSNPFTSSTQLATMPSQKVDVASLPETFAQKAKIGINNDTTQVQRPFEPWPEDSKFPSPYPFFHLDAEYETLSAPPTPQLSQAVPSMDTTDGGSVNKGEDKELFESSMDKVFQRFADRIAQNPEQVLRYEFNGSPLLCNVVDAVGRLLEPGLQKPGAKITASGVDGSRIPRCNNCGSSRVFEVQLTPHAIAVLEEDEISIEGMDWGTIILGVCSQDCSSLGTSDGEVGYVEEWIGIQWEELEDRRR
jgi:pre-rRNA-processing protein TSR4